MQIPTGPTAIQREILAFAQAFAGEINGTPVTNLEAVLKTMKALMKDKPELGRILLQYFLEASKEEQEFKVLVLREALAHKKEWGPRFAAAARAGEAPPNVYPNPDDILIGSDNSVRFDGPVTAEEARALEALLEYRDVLFRTAGEVIAATGATLSIQEARELWSYLRRRYYRYVSKQIPKRHRQPFPSFEIGADQ